ncbi:MAG: urease subunit beta [Gloeomargarita sp. SKYG98]|nr:urease subunit beta [Gloeomargarita sp. SKYG98]
MIPDEIITPDSEIELNAGRPTLTITVSNRGDRPIQVGSHYHFYKVNSFLEFDWKKNQGNAPRYSSGHSSAL